MSDKAPRFSLGKTGSYKERGLHRRMSRTVWEASFAGMNGWEQRSMTLTPGDHVKFKCDCHSASGTLRIELLAPDGATVMSWAEATSYISEYVAGTEGKHHLRVTAENAEGGRYRVELLGE